MAVATQRQLLRRVLEARESHNWSGAASVLATLERTLPEGSSEIQLVREQLLECNENCGDMHAAQQAGSRWLQVYLETTLDELVPRANRPVVAASRSTGAGFGNGVAYSPWSAVSGPPVALEQAKQHLHAMNMFVKVAVLTPGDVDVALKSYDRACIILRALTLRCRDVVTSRDWLRVLLGRAALSAQRKDYNDALRDYNKAERIMHDAKLAAEFNEIDRTYILRYIWQERGLFHMRFAHNSEGEADLARAGMASAAAESFPNPLYGSLVHGALPQSVVPVSAWPVEHDPELAREKLNLGE